jgi:hypothetical protein
MLKQIALLSVSLFSLSPLAYSLDFSLNAAGQLAGAREVKLELPQVSPAPALKGPACRPFLLETAVGGVAETVTVMRACTADNAPIWILSVGLRGKPGLQARVDSSKYPEHKAALEKRIMGAAIDGLSQADADFIVNKTGPLLARAAAAPGAEREKLLAQAAEELEAHLARL